MYMYVCAHIYIMYIFWHYMHIFLCFQGIDTFLEDVSGVHEEFNS